MIIISWGFQPSWAWPDFPTWTRTKLFGFSSKMSSVAFSSDGVEVISRQLETELTLGGTDRSREQLEAFYELERCSAFITDNDYHRVNIQIQIVWTLLHLLVKAELLCVVTLYKAPYIRHH